MLGEPAHPLRQIEGVAGEDDLKFDLVVEMRLGEEAIDVVIHETPGEIVGYIARYEGIEADTHVDVGQSVKADQQRKTAKILVAVIVPLIGPDRVGDEFAIERQREGPGPHADDFGRVPVRHDAEYRPAAVQVGMRAAEQFDLARDIGERGCRPSRPLPARGGRRRAGGLAEGRAARRRRRRIPRRWHRTQEGFRAR